MVRLLPWTALLPYEAPPSNGAKGEALSMCSAPLSLLLLLLLLLVLLLPLSARGVVRVLDVGRQPRMPELPEVERARRELERQGLPL